MGCIIQLLPHSFSLNSFVQIPLPIYILLNFYSPICLLFRHTLLFCSQTCFPSFPKYKGLFYCFCKALILGISSWFLTKGWHATWSTQSINQAGIEKRTLMSPIFSIEGAADVRKQNRKKNYFKTIWLKRTLPFRLHVQFISVHMQCQDYKVRLMSMAKPYAVIHHHNKA